MAAFVRLYDSFDFDFDVFLFLLHFHTLVMWARIISHDVSLSITQEESSYCSYSLFKPHWAEKCWRNFLNKNFYRHLLRAIYSMETVQIEEQRKINGWNEKWLIGTYSLKFELLFQYRTRIVRRSMKSVCKSKTNTLSKIYWSIITNEFPLTVTLLNLVNAPCDIEPILFSFVLE